MTNEKTIMPSSYVKLSYTVYDDEGNELYSTVKKRKIGDKEEEVEEPVVIKIGAKEVFFEEVLLGKKEGERVETDIPPEKAFGKRDPKRIISMPIKKLRAVTGKKVFRVGDELYTNDNQYFGVIKYVGSREVLIDQNHPLSGKTLKLVADIIKVVNPEDLDVEKINIILEKFFGEFKEKMNINIDVSSLEIVLPSEQLASMDDSTLFRYIYLPRKIAAQEILHETGIKRVIYRDEFSLITEREITKAFEPAKIDSIAEAISEVSELSKEEKKPEEKASEDVKEK